MLTCKRFYEFCEDENILIISCINTEGYISKNPFIVPFGLSYYMYNVLVFISGPLSWTPDGTTPLNQCSIFVNQIWMNYPIYADFIDATLQSNRTLEPNLTCHIEINKHRQQWSFTRSRRIQVIEGPEAKRSVWDYTHLGQTSCQPGDNPVA